MAALGLVLWFGLVTWRLGSVPGMSLDEAWSILAARGQWPPANPLSGMTSYSGPFPVLLLRLMDTAQGVWILRGASALANGGALILLGLLLRRIQPSNGRVLWSLLPVATLPVWLVVLRTGIEVVMFTPLLCVLGLYLLALQTRRAAFAGGLAWGLLVYNHLIGLCFPVAVVGAWLVTYRRRPPIPLAQALLGGLTGVAPRLLALAFYHEPLEGSAAGYSLLGALADLRWLPLCLWQTWHGDAVYLRYVGRMAIEPWPYWLLGTLFVIPWVRRMRSVPKVVWFTLLTALLTATLVTLAAPYLAVRFFIVPVIGLTVSLVVCGHAASEHDRRWRWPIAAATLGITGFNLFYCISDFYRPWQAGTLGHVRFFFGHRSKYTGNWPYYPKETLVRDLLTLRPVPEQIITVPTLERPLRVLLDGSPIRVTLATTADLDRQSAFVDYRYPSPPDPHCIGTPRGERCFQNPKLIGDYYVIYQ